MHRRCAGAPDRLSAPKRDPYQIWRSYIDLPPRMHPKRSRPSRLSMPEVWQAEMRADERLTIFLERLKRVEGNIATEEADQNRS